MASSEVLLLPDPDFEISNMIKLNSFVLAALVLGTNLTLHAQAITVTVTGWTVVQAFGAANVPINGASATGAIVGASTAQIGTTMSGAATFGQGFFQGTNTGGAAISGSSAATIGGTETYTLNFGGGSGKATHQITVQPGNATSIARTGNNHRGAANANVTVDWPGGGPLAATVQIRDVQGQPPILLTLPVTQTTTVFTTASSLTMNSRADISGSVGNGTLTMNAICEATGLVKLQ